MQEKELLFSITEDNSNALTKQANDMGLQKGQIVQIVPNSNGTVSLYYYA